MSIKKRSAKLCRSSKMLFSGIDITSHPDHFSIKFRSHFFHSHFSIKAQSASIGRGDTEEKFAHPMCLKEGKGIGEQLLSQSLPPHRRNQIEQVRISRSLLLILYDLQFQLTNILSILLDQDKSIGKLLNLILYPAKVIFRVAEILIRSKACDKRIPAKGNDNLPVLDRIDRFKLKNRFSPLPAKVRVQERLPSREV
jgi:hypothetical protein